MSNATALSTRESVKSLNLLRFLGPLVAGLLFVILPYYLDGFWLQTGLFFMAAAVGALGLVILTGVCGQLSLAHSFFIAVGAYAYIIFSSGSGPASDGRGLGLPPSLAALLAVVSAGLVGLAFSPVAARVRGLYLGIATIGLVFLGQHVLFNATPFTGGFNGRDVPVFSILGFDFADALEPLLIAGVPFGRVERLWYLFAVILLFAFLFARNLVHGRPGRAMSLLRDEEPAAIAMGVAPNSTRGQAFLYSSMFAGLAGVMLGLVYQHVVPETFSLQLAISYLVMIVLGGLTRVEGAIAGALFVTLVPAVLQKYGNELPFLASASRGGVGAAELAAILYGAGVIAVVMFEPGGLVALVERLRGRLRSSSKMREVAKSVQNRQ